MATSQAVTGIHFTPIISSLTPPTVTTETRIPTLYINKQAERVISQQQSRDGFIPEAQSNLVPYGLNHVSQARTTRTIFLIHPKPRDWSKS